MEKLISIKEASNLLGISGWSLRRSHKEYIAPLMTEGGHKRIDVV